VAYVDVPDDLWRKDPAAVNAEIIKRIEKREPPPRPVAPPSAVTNLGIALARNDPPPLDFSKREDLQRWLAGKSTDVTVVFVARGALRSFPLLCDALGPRGGGVSRIGKNVILPVFRAIAAAWVAGRYHGAGPTLFDAVAAANFSLPASGSAPDDAGIAVRTAMAAASFAADSFAGASLDDPNSDAAHAAFVSAAEVIADARLIEQGWSAAALADHPLWSAEFPSRERDYWGHLERALLKENPDWKVWTDWYRARLEGRPADEVVEVARVMIAEGIWQQGPRAVNAEIARLIDSNRQSELDRPDTVTVLPRPEYTISIADDSTIVIGFSNYAGGLLSNFVKALKQSIDNAQFIAIFETVETAKSLVVHLDPLVVPAAELAEKIAELIEDQRIAVPASLRPPDALLPSPSPATRFTYANGRFDIASSDAWRDREARAGAYHSRARDLAAGLAERLSRTDAVPDVAGSVKALIDVLGESVAEVQPDLLRLASRSIAARARAYGHPAAQWEISADAVGAFFELADVLVDLQTFVRTDLEAHERAVRELDLTPEKAADAKIALDLVTDAILSAPEVISETAQTAFEAAAEVSQTAADQDVKVAVEGDRTLLTANLALAVARELGRDVKGADHETAVQTGDHPAGKLPPRELGPKPGEPEKRKTRTRRTKAADARAAERSWQGFADRVVARIYDKGPNRIADATVDALTGIIRHGPKTAFGLGAALVLWAASSPIVAGGALATTIGWISYELRRKSKHPK
jgi:hypothetical protein